MYKPRPNSGDTPSTIRPSIPSIIAHQGPHTRTCEIRGKKEWNIHKPVSFSLFCLVQRPFLQLGPIHIRCLVWILLRFCYARPPVVHSRAGQGSLLLSFFFTPILRLVSIHSLWLIFVYNIQILRSRSRCSAWINSTNQIRLNVILKKNKGTKPKQKKRKRKSSRAAWLRGVGSGAYSSLHHHWQKMRSNRPQDGTKAQINESTAV